jgi:hypothetical protein
MDSGVFPHGDPRQLTRLAEHLEQLAPFLRRADSRHLALERAAKLRAETALIAAASPAPASWTTNARPGEERPWT